MGTPTTQRAVLGSELRLRRGERRLAPAAVANELDWSEHKLGQVERGQQTMSPAELDKLIRVLGVVGEDADRLRELGKAARRRGDYGNVSDWARTYVGLETDAVRVLIFSETVTPGLLQSERYARAVASASVVAAPGDVDRLVAGRARRRQRLLEPNPPQVHVVLDEAAIRRSVGSTEIMQEQIQLLLDLGAQPHVTIQVLPFSAGAHPSQGSSFTILHLADSAFTLIYTEDLTSAQYLKQSHVAWYERVHELLCKSALSADETAALFKTMIEKEGV